MAATGSPKKRKRIAMRNPVAAVIGDPAERPVPKGWDWARNSKILAIGWTAMRVWLGIMWIQAGAAKLWGAESAGFIHNNGAGVAGFAAHGTPAYTWWGTFLHGFVVPNAGWIGVLIAVAFFAIVILAMWRTSTGIGLDGLLASYRQNHHTGRHHLSLHRTPAGTRPPVP